MRGLFIGTNLSRKGPRLLGNRVLGFRHVEGPGFAVGPVGGEGRLPTLLQASSACSSSKPLQTLHGVSIQLHLTLFLPAEVPTLAFSQGFQGSKYSLQAFLLHHHHLSKAVLQSTCQNLPALAPITPEQFGALVENFM